MVPLIYAWQFDKRTRGAHGNLGNFKSLLESVEFRYEAYTGREREGRVVGGGEKELICYELISLIPQKQVPRFPNKAILSRESTILRSGDGVEVATCQ